MHRVVSFVAASPTDWITAITTVVIAVGAFISYATVQRQQRRRQASRVVVRVVGEPSNGPDTGGPFKLSIGVENTSDMPIFDPVLESWAPPDGTYPHDLFSMRDLAVDTEQFVKPDPIRPALGRLSADDGQVILSVDVPGRKWFARVYFLDAYQRVWRYDVRRRRLSRRRRRTVPSPTR